MSHTVTRPEIEDVNTLNERVAAVKLGRGTGKTSGVKPFEAYLEEGSIRTVNQLTGKTIPELLGDLRRPRRLVIDESCPLYWAGRRFQKKHKISEESFQNWRKLLSGFLDIPVTLLLNPSSFDVERYEHMVRQSSTLRWLEETLSTMKLGLCEVIVADMFPMVPDKLLKSKKFADDWFEIVADSFELTVECLLYIRPQILISCQCCTTAENEKWGSFGHAMARELCSSEDSARLQMVKPVDVRGHQVLVVKGVHPQNVVQHKPQMEGDLKELLRKVLGPFGQWKERRLAAEREVAMVTEGVRDGMKMMMRQMQFYKQICGQEVRYGIPLAVGVERVDEWGKQIQGWAKEMDS